jgi:hypothetical protein
VPVVDPEQQFAITDGTSSTRHKVTDNLIASLDLMMRELHDRFR